jgi:hypothetical protein
MKRHPRHVSAALACAIVIALTGNSGWGATCFSDPTNPPICTAKASDKVCSGDSTKQCYVNADCTGFGTCVSAGVTTIGVTAVPFTGTQITSASISGSANLVTVPASVSGGINATVTFRVVQTNTTPTLDDVATVIVNQSNGASCTVGADFHYQSSAGSTPQTICPSMGGYALDVLSVIPSPIGTTACSSHLANCTDSPGLPSGYDFQTNDSRVLSVQSPITGPAVDMKLTRAGPTFLSNLRMMYSRFNGSSFPTYTDITYDVQPGSTIIRGTGQWSPIKIVAGLPPAGSSGALTPTLGEWGMIIMSLLLLTASSVLLTRRRAALSPGGPSGNPGLPLLDAGLLGRMVAGTATLGLISFMIATGLGWTPSATDVVGSLLGSGILAYLLHYWITVAKHNGKGGSL